MNNIYLNFLQYKFKQYNIKNILVIDDAITIDEAIYLSKLNFFIIFGIDNTFLRQKYAAQLRNNNKILIESLSTSITRTHAYDAIMAKNINEEIISSLPKVDCYFSRSLLTNVSFVNFVKDTDLLVVNKEYINSLTKPKEPNIPLIKIGLAITCTSSRFNIVEKQLKYLNNILNNSYYDYIISVFCDEELSEENKSKFEVLKNKFSDIKFENKYLKSIAKAKNGSIQPLIDYGCEFYFCLDDDAIIVDIRAINYYVEACRYFHFMHLHLTGYLKDKETDPILIKSFKNFDVKSYAYDTGCFIVFDKEVLDKCGKWDENFEGWGGEHGEFGKRAEKILLNDELHHLAIPEVYEKEYVVALDACFKVLLKPYNNFKDLTSMMVNSNIDYDRNETNSKNVSLNKKNNDDFKVDIVVPYVDNTDKNWQKLFNDELSKISPEKQEQYHLSSIEENSRRFEYNSLFKYFFRSIEKYIPWVNNVFLIVQSESQIPSWINKETVKIVYHKDFIPEQFLPTFNANTIESFLHKIPGLGENFIYGNDDLIFNTYLRHEEFFDKGNPKNGFYKIFDLKQITPFLDVPKNNKEGYYYCFKNSYILAYNNFKNKIKREKNERICKYHSFTPFKKSNYEKYFNKIENYIMNTTTPFRNPTNINQYYFALCFGFETNFKYILNVSSEYEFLRMFNLQNVDAQVECINCLYTDSNIPTICLNNFKNDNSLIEKLLDRKFNEKSKYEN